jgi:hypothetical protein
MKNLRGALWAVFILLLCLAAGAGTAPLINLANQVKGVLSATNGGTGANITAPSANGYYPCGFVVTASASVPMTCPLSGLTARSVNGTTSTDTILYSDNNEPVDYQGSVAVAVSLPTPTTLGNSHFWTLLNNLTTGSSTVVTVTPAGSWTVNGSSTLPIAQGSECSLHVDPHASTNWIALCSGNGVGGAVSSVCGDTGAVTNLSGCGSTGPTPSSVVAFPVEDTNVTVWNNYSIWTALPASSVVVLPHTFQVGFKVTSGTADISKAYVFTTARASTTITTSTQITFSSSNTASFSTGEHMSDNISLTMDATHDYYIGVLMANDSNNMSVGLPQSNSSYGFVPCYYAAGDSVTSATTVPWNGNQDNVNTFVDRVLWIN